MSRFAVFTSNPSTVAEHPFGWEPLTGTFTGWETTRLPMVDNEHDVFARCDYRDSLAVAARFGAQLLTVAQHDEVYAQAFKLTPVIIRETHEETAERLSRGGTDALERLATIEWARRSDDGIRAQLVDWDGIQPVSNGWKCWVAGASPGRALNYGWRSNKAPNGRIWQTLGTRHLDSHTDSSQLLDLIRKRCA